MKKTLIAASALLMVAGAAHAESATYALDPTHTFVTFEVAHMGTSTNRGRFDKKEGTVTIDKAAKTGKLEITIDPTSISSGTPGFDKHLQSKDFFNVAEFKEIKFVGDKFTFDGDKVAQIDGQLTFLGKTNPVTLKAVRYNCFTNNMLKREVCGGDFEATIARSQWGQTWGSNFGVPDNVKLVIQAEGIKQ